MAGPEIPFSRRTIERWKRMGRNFKIIRPQSETPETPDKETPPDEEKPNGGSQPK